MPVLSYHLILNIVCIPLTSLENTSLILGCRKAGERNIQLDLDRKSSSFSFRGTTMSRKFYLLIFLSQTQLMFLIQYFATGQDLGMQTILYCEYCTECKVPPKELHLPKMHPHKADLQQTGHSYHIFCFTDCSSQAPWASPGPACCLEAKGLY